VQATSREYRELEFHFWNNGRARSRISQENATAAEKERHCSDFGKGFSNLSDLSEAGIGPELRPGESEAEHMSAATEAVTALLGKDNGAECVEHRGRDAAVREKWRFHASL